MKIITIHDIDMIASGVAILGSGGGGEPSLERLVAQDLIRTGHTIRLIGIDELPENALIVPVAFVGAPLVSLEKIPTIYQMELLLNAISAQAGDRPIVVMPAEIGGSNGVFPLIVGAMLNVPVLDADLMGRAFPEIPMVTPTLHGIEPSPFIIVGSDATVTIAHCTGMRVEEISRTVCVEFGSSVLIATYCMDSATARRVVVPDTISQAHKLGELLNAARAHNTDPIAALCAYAAGIEVTRGVITDIVHTLEKGFLKGCVTIVGESNATVIFKNEYLVAERDGTLCATTPDIIALLDTETGAALTTESLARGLRCALVVFQSPESWRTPEGLKLVGPQAFGFSTSYVSPHTQGICT